MKRHQVFALALVITGAVLACVPVGAQTRYFECPDEATSLPEAGETSFGPWDIVENDLGAYAVAKSLPGHISVDAVYRLGPGDEWLLSLTEAAHLPRLPPGTTTSQPRWDRRDVFLWDGADGYLPYGPFDGAVALMPAGANVDAAFVDATGAVVVSFDAETTIASIQYDQADLVRYDRAAGRFDAVPYFDASQAGIDTSSNLISADRRGLLTVLSLDVRTIVGTAEFVPGELISWNGRTLELFDRQPGWPADLSRQVNALTFPAASLAAGPGSVGPSLTIERYGGASLRLTWTTSDCAGGVNAAIYQGNLSSLPAYDHAPVVCGDAFPFLEEVVPLPDGDAYFIVAARVVAPDGGGAEGSYGLHIAGGFVSERPAAQESCDPMQILDCQ